MTNLAVVAVFAGVCIAGCGGLRTLDSDCTGNGVCKVGVVVADCVARPDQDSLWVKGKEIDIFWELDPLSSASYRFRSDDGVALKTSSPEFVEPKAQANNRKFKLHDKNSLKEHPTYTYPYTFNVQRWKISNWVDCPPMDPTIVNQG